MLRDVESIGPVDGYVVLGDLVAIGPDPVGVLERLRALPNARSVRGNGERYVVTGDRPSWFEEGRTEVEIHAIRLEMNNSFVWTRGHVTDAGWLDWLSGLPFELRLVLPDGTRMLCVHATHRRDDESSLIPARSDGELRATVRDADAELILAGHTHRTMDRVLGPRLRIANPGSVSNPLPDGDDTRAGWALLEALPAGYTLTRHRVDYDHEAFAEQCRRVRHPAAEFMIALQRLG